MKASIFPLWWNPWGDEGIKFDDTKVSISIDNFKCEESAQIKILFLAEPYSIIPSVNDEALKQAHLFDKIYTFNQNVIDAHKQSELFLWGSSWLDFDDLKLNKKNHITFVTSNKGQTIGHKLRLSIYDGLNNFDEVNKMEVYTHRSPPFHHRRNDFFETSLFHISVENSQQKNYFTEKVIDCFASKTIPIYWGCPNLGEWFNMDGVIAFNNIDDLKNIFDYIDEDYYNSKMQVIEENYEIAKQFHGINDVVPRLTNTIIEEVNKNATKRI